VEKLIYDDDAMYLGYRFIDVLKNNNDQAMVEIYHNEHKSEGGEMNSVFITLKDLKKIVANIELHLQSIS